MKRCDPYLSWWFVLVLFSIILVACGGSGGGHPLLDEEEENGSNNAPVADAGPDMTVPVNTRVTLDGGGSYDPDGDPISYSRSLSSCPDDDCPIMGNSDSSTCNVTVNRPGQYTVQLRLMDPFSGRDGDSMTIDVVEYPPQLPNLYSQKWKHRDFGRRLGRSGLSVVDLDNNGLMEIVAGTTDFGHLDNTIWFIMKHNGTDGYDMTWSSPIYDTVVRAVITADTDQDNIYEIYVGLENGDVYIYNGATFSEIAVLSTGSEIVSMAVGDTNGNGAMEIVCSDGDDLSVFHAETQLLAWSSSNRGGETLAIGNVDADSSPEIVVSTENGNGYVLNGSDQELEWEYSNGFGNKVRVGDIDNDGMDEIVGVDDTDEGRIIIFQADTHNADLDIQTNQSVGALRLLDVAASPGSEILYEDRSGDRVYCLNGSSFAELWSMASGHDSLYDMAIGDLDDDGDMDIAFGGEEFSSGSLAVADIQTTTIEWRNLRQRGPYSVVAVGDADDDGQDEIVMVTDTFHLSPDNVIINVFDAQTNVLEWQSSNLPSLRSLSGVNAVLIGDVDDDTDTEIVLAVSDFGGRGLLIYNGSTHVLEPTSDAYVDRTFTNLAIGDVDDDGDTEIVTAENIRISGTTEPYITVFNGSTGQEEWQSGALGDPLGRSWVYDFDLVDVDNDGNCEIIATVDWEWVYAFDGVTHAMDWSISLPAYAITAKDIDDDDVVEILVGKEDGLINTYDGITFELENTYYTSMTQPIDSLLIEDIDGDGTDETVIGDDDHLVIFNNDLTQLLWETGNLGGELGHYNRLIVRDVDGDNHKDLIFGSRSALYQYD